MNPENQPITIELAEKNLEYAINLYNCIEKPLNEKIIAFAAQDKTATAYRNLAIQSLKGENVEGYVFTAKNSALDRVFHWRRWIREYKEGITLGEEKGKRKTALSMLKKGLSPEIISDMYRSFYARNRITPK
ncbi:MAG: hypothetical protein LBG04_03745 [Holosporaceae bacterium]|jgi:hypothetical protein|nr:hypothetical protein [Holosporaceae bacterium]